VPAQAAELDRLGNIRTRPVPLVKKRTTMEGRTMALTTKAIVGLKGPTSAREDDLVMTLWAALAGSPLRHFYKK
jgi:hypothetical protein